MDAKVTWKNGLAFDGTSDSPVSRYPWMDLLPSAVRERVSSARINGGKPGGMHCDGCDLHPPENETGSVRVRG